MPIMKEIKLKNRPSYYYEHIVRLSKIGWDRVIVGKVDFSKCSVFETRCMTEAGEKPLTIHANNTCGKFLKLVAKIFLKVGA